MNAPHRSRGVSREDCLSLRALPAPLTALTEASIRPRGLNAQVTLERFQRPRRRWLRRPAMWWRTYWKSGEYLTFANALRACLGLDPFREES